MKSVTEGKTKWIFGQNNKNLPKDFHILGRVKSAFAPWISVFDIGGSSRVNCDLMSVLSLVGDTNDFDLNEFQVKNKGLFYLVKIKLKF